MLDQTREVRWPRYIRLAPIVAAVALMAFSAVVPTAAAEESRSSVWVTELTDSPDPATMGENVTYRITVTNGGPADAINATMRTGVPDGSRFVSSRLTVGPEEQAACLPDEGGSLECAIGALGADQQAVLELVVRPLQVGTLYIGASATADNSVGGATTEPIYTTYVRAPEDCTVVGTEGADQLSGTPEQDVICAFGGDDRIVGGDGDDVLDGGPGSDDVSGGGGEDSLTGGSGRDELFGRDGADLIDARDGVGGNDLARGGSGKDVLRIDRGDLQQN